MAKKKYFLSSCFAAFQNWFSLVALLLLCFCPALKAAESTINIVADAFPPFCYRTRDGGIDGLAVRAYHLMAKQARYEPNAINLLPWPRAYKSLQENANTMVLAINRTSEREDKFLWIGPFYQANEYLYRLERTKINIASEDQLKQFSYGVKRGASAEAFLRRAGVPSGQIDSVDEDIQNLHKLRMGRVDMVPLLPIELRYYVKAIGAQESEFVPTYAALEANLYFAFNRNFPRLDFERLQAAFEQLQESSAFARLQHEHYPQASEKK